MKHFRMTKWVRNSFLFVCFFASINAVPDENDGQYHPDDEGRYIPDDSGKYIPDYSGLYNDDGSGRYNGDNSGKYSHVNNKYRHQRERPYPYSSPSSLEQGNFFKNSRTNSASASLLEKQNIQLAPTSNTIAKSPVKYEKYNDNRWKIIRLASNVGDNGFHWEYETENKISGEENAKIYKSGTKDETLRTKGFYQYTGTDNKVYNVEYTADENGFIPKGNHFHPLLQKAILETLNEKNV